MKASKTYAALRTLLFAVATLHAAVAAAQNTFDSAPVAPHSPRKQAAQPVAPSAPESSPGPGDATASYGNSPRSGMAETQDFGIPPTNELRPSNQLHGPTPTKIPGGSVIGTQALRKLLQDKQSGVLLLDVYGAQTSLPDAISVVPAAQGGSFTDNTQREFGEYLQTIAKGDKSRPLVLYCEGVNCWMSYNAALRAIKLGYQKVMWYRGGLEAWQQAGLPTRAMSGQPR